MRNTEKAAEAVMKLVDELFKFGLPWTLLRESYEKDLRDHQAKGAWAVIVILLVGESILEDWNREAVLRSLVTGLEFDTPPEDNRFVIPRHPYATDDEAVAQLTLIATEMNYPKRRQTLYTRGSHLENQNWDELGEVYDQLEFATP